MNNEKKKYEIPDLSQLLLAGADPIEGSIETEPTELENIPL